MLFFQKAWDMAVGAPYARDAGCVVRFDAENNPDIRSWKTEGLDACIARCDKKSLLNVAVFANPDVENIVLERFYA